MKLASLAIVGASIGGIVSAARFGGSVATKYTGRGERCGTFSGTQGVTVTAPCGPNLECFQEFCELKSDLTPEVRSCIQNLRSIGVNVKLGDATLYGGYCYTNSCTEMYGKVYTCEVPEGYYGRGCKYCIKTSNDECIPGDQNQEEYITNKLNILFRELGISQAI